MRCLREVMAISPIDEEYGLIGNIPFVLWGSNYRGVGGARKILREALSSTIIERSVPVKHDPKPRRTCVYFYLCGLYGANPYNPWVIRGYPV